MIIPLFVHVVVLAYVMIVLLRVNPDKHTVLISIVGLLTHIPNCGYGSSATHFYYAQLLLRTVQQFLHIT